MKIDMQSPLDPGLLSATLFFSGNVRYRIECQPIRAIDLFNLPTCYSIVPEFLSQQ